ncbi:MAG: class I SAM-dependent methyltransferase [Candidatus Stahlbacteria bacterium]|nr:MAG: class I SAM-dependent methyltransferase [Candidatus Stahlbacteria bacterium]
MPSVHRLRRRGVEFLPWGVAEARMVDKLLDPQPGEKLLEVGCSSGYRIEGYAGKGVEFWGVDADHEAIEVGKQRGSPVNLIEADAGNLPFADGFFDKVLCVHLLEHLPDPARAIGEMSRVLRCEGTAVIVVPCERIRGDTAFAGWLRFQNLHLHRFTPPQITSLLLPHFFIEKALFHTLIPGQFKKMPLDRTTLLYYLSLAMLFKLRKTW